jgi:hypothetical protein
MKKSRIIRRIKTVLSVSLLAVTVACSNNVNMPTEESKSTLSYVESDASGTVDTKINQNSPELEQDYASTTWYSIPVSAWSVLDDGETIDTTGFETGQYRPFAFFISDYNEEGSYLTIEELQECNFTIQDNVESAQTTHKATLTFTGLKPDTYYYVYAYRDYPWLNSTTVSKDKYNQSLVTILRVKTRLLPENPVTVDLVSTTSTTIRVKATGGDGDGLYQIGVAVSNDPARVDYWSSSDKNGEFIVSGLTPNKQYYVFAYREASDEVDVNMTSFPGLAVKTDSSGDKSREQPAPTITVVSIENDQIKIQASNGDETGNTVDDLRRYSFAISETDSLSDSRHMWFQSNDGYDFSYGEYTFIGLSPDTTYYIFSYRDADRSGESGKYALLKDASDISVIAVKTLPRP